MHVVSVAEAARAVVAAVPRQPPLRLALLDALDHVLAEDVLAGVALPPWTNAGMDGYAARAEDVRGTTPARPIQLRVVETIAAGAITQQSLNPGDAARIYTGAPVPRGADSVIRQEDTERRDGVVMVFSDRDAGANVRRAGGDLATGALALAAGTVIGPHQVALLAALAVAHPVVHRRPRVGILTSGDELVSLDHPDEILAATRQADVNGPALCALVRQAGGIAVPLGIARDDPDDLRQRIEAADDIDLLITAGGVSVGDHDHVRAVMTSLGVTTAFDRVRVRPGGPTVFGTFPGGRPWLALPGNPVSAMVTFELFGRPAIRTMAGYREPFRPAGRAVLGQDARPDATLDQYLRVTMAVRGDGELPTAMLTGPQGSGMLMSIARADGLVIVPAGGALMPAGTVVTAFRFD
jgi:molybdopterin molybdotransferase